MDNGLKILALGFLAIIGVKSFIGKEKKDKEAKKEEIFYEDNKKVEEPKAPEEKKEN